MASEKKRVLILDRYQHGVILNVLNSKRTDLIKEGRATDAVDEVLVKAIKAPEKKRWKGACKCEAR